MWIYLSDTMTAVLAGGLLLAAVLIAAYMRHALRQKEPHPPRSDTTDAKDSPGTGG